MLGVMSMGKRVSELVVDSYDIELLLDASAAESFRSRTTVRFSCNQASTYADLAATKVQSVVLNGHPLAVWEVWDGARLELSGFEPVNVLEVEALFPYAVNDRGLRRATDPGGAVYVYGMNVPNASPRVFCCFDDPGLRAQVNVNLSAPNGWTCLVNGTVAPLAPYLVVGAAGPWSQLHQTVIASQGTPVPLAVYAQRTRAAEQDRGRQIADLMTQSIAFYEDKLGVPYPYENCEALFVRDLPSLAFSTPGLILFADKVFDLIETRGPQYAATVISHEVAHAWIGSLVDCDDAPWLVEACTTYIGRNAVLHLLPGSEPWEAGDPPPPDASYAPDAELIKELEKTIGRENILQGLGTFCRRFAHQNTGQAELAACWSETSGHDLATWAAGRQTS